MKFAAACAKPGYPLENMRQDGFAKNEGGVCITVWRQKLFTDGGFACLDLFDLQPPASPRKQKAGHVQRTRSHDWAVPATGGLLDVMLITADLGHDKVPTLCGKAH